MPIKMPVMGLLLFAANSVVLLMSLHLRAISDHLAWAWLFMASGFIVFVVWALINKARLRLVRRFTVLESHCDLLDLALAQLVPKTSDSQLRTTTQQSVEKADEGVNNELSQTVQDELRRVEQQLIREVEFGIEQNASRLEDGLTFSKTVQESLAVLEPIADITHQLRLLAINAKTQSVLAGEPGKGFAMVADKLILLSKMTESAIKMLNQQIQSDQATTAPPQGTANTNVRPPYKGYFSGIIKGMDDIDDVSLQLMGHSLSEPTKTAKSPKPTDQDAEFKANVQLVNTCLNLASAMRSEIDSCRRFV